MSQHHEIQEPAIAIIGMAGRFPDAPTVETFWQNILNGKKSIRFFSEEEVLAAGADPVLVKLPDYVKAGTIIEDIDLFDAAFFGFTPREAEAMDPQARLFLECAWWALEDAGYDPEQYRGLIGVFAGKGFSNYMSLNLYTHPDLMMQLGKLQVAIGNERDSLAAMVAYKLNLRGPSISVQTFCSTSMVAIHLACQSLLMYECDMALAGGVAIELPQGTGYLYQEGGILSPDGSCRTFDTRARGSVMGNGLGVVMLKRLEDALADNDQIYAAILGSATNNDGISRVGFTAPGLNGQTAVILDAITNARVPAESISYIEAHGTATKLGDSIELAAMKKAFRQHTDKKQFCAIGSVKPNVGHLDRASGVTGLIKTALSLKQAVLPPHLNFHQATEDVGLEESPFYVNKDKRAWPETADYPRRAGVSSFGLGGTNVHVIMQEVPQPATEPSKRSHHLLLLSARTETSLKLGMMKLADYLGEEEDANIADIAHTLQTGRRSFNHRCMLVCTSAEHAHHLLQGAEPARLLTREENYRERPTAFMFSGLGDHYVNMGRDLYQQEPVFRQTVDRCCTLLEPTLGFDLRTRLFNEKSTGQTTNALRQMLGKNGNHQDGLQETAVAQPAVFVIEYALACLLQSWGLRPQAMMGYSLGEYVAATLAGVFTLETALQIVAKRAELIQSLPAGRMVAVAAPGKEVEPYLTSGVQISAVMGKTSVVIAGSLADVQAVEEKLQAAEIIVRPLNTTHAFHTDMMLPIVDTFRAYLQTVSLSAPQTNYISNVTGNWVTAKQVTKADYWIDHLCQPVQWYQGLNTLLQNQALALIEIGGGKSLTSLVRQHPANTANCLVVSTLRSAYESQADLDCLLQAVGQLWLAGVSLQWDNLYAGEQRRAVSLPGYAYDRQRYWIDPDPHFLALWNNQATETAVTSSLTTEAAPIREKTAPSVHRRKERIEDWFYTPTWQPRPLDINNITPETTTYPWLILLDALGVGEQLVDYIQKNGGTAIRVYPGNTFQQKDETTFTINPAKQADYAALIEILEEKNSVPQKIAHMWSLGTYKTHQDFFTTFEPEQQVNLFSFVLLARTLSNLNINDSIEIIGITSHMQDVYVTDRIQPDKASIQAVCRSIPQEYFMLTCRTLDLDVEHPPIAAQLWAELALGSEDLDVAYRQEKRLVQVYEATPLEKPEPSRLRQQGVYLITGGMGDIGLVLSTYLAQHYQARLVLVNRSSLPEREVWDAWLATHDAFDPVSLRIQKIRELEALGAEVMAMAADVSDKAQMTHLIAQAEAQFGRLHGVIHAAGVSDEKAFSIIQNVKPENCTLHYQPKVYGTYVLKEVLAEKELDFCVMFSSLSSNLGGLGFLPYSVANIVMDMIVRQRNKTAVNKWHVVNWDTWRIREDTHAILGATLAMYEMLPAEGIQAFEHVIGQDDHHQLVNSTGDIDMRIQQWIRLDPVKIVRPNEQHHARPPLSTAYVAPSSSYEKRVADIWQEILGIEQIGIYDNFFDLGGNSLIGLQVIARVKKEFDTQVPIVALFEAPTISTLTKYLRTGQKQEEDVTQQKLNKRRKRARKQTKQEGIAIISMAGRFPQAPDVETFWGHICNGYEAISTFTEEELVSAGIPKAMCSLPNYVKARPILESAGLFDPTFFGYSPREAELTDPQQRLFLETAWHALELAGYDPQRYPGLIGLFGGSNISSYVLDLIGDADFIKSLGAYEATYQVVIGNDRDSLATNISYKLNLKGPSLTVQTFCSTSLVATHLACQSLLNGECDIALAGGVSIRTPIKSGYLYHEGGMESQDGHCRTFDAQATGTLFGDAVAFTVLKRLEDAIADGDTIHAVIKGSAMNNDGSLKVGYAAPSVEGQANVIATAIENAGLTADAIGYIEAHGTATRIGDPIEVAALTKAFQRTTNKLNFCAIGSIKPNVGHLDRAAGVSGLIKAALMVKHGLIPPLLHFETANPEIDFENSPFYVPPRLQAWKEESPHKPRRSGISSLGMGGTNVHVIVEEPPAIIPSSPSRADHLLVLSARTSTTLAQIKNNLVAYLEDNPTVPLADIAYTLQTGRARMDWRQTVVCQTHEEAVQALLHEAPDQGHYVRLRERPFIFAFTDLTADYSQLVTQLYQQETSFRETIDYCCNYLQANFSIDLFPHFDPHAVVILPPATLKEQHLMQFITQYAMAGLFIEWGVKPQGLIGYSIGQFVAACLADVVSLENSLHVLVQQAQLITNQVPWGEMLFINSGLNTISGWLEDVYLVTYSEQKCLVAGIKTAVSELTQQLQQAHISYEKTPAAYPLHTPIMETITAQLTTYWADIPLHAPKYPIMIDGKWLTESTATHAHYWAKRLSLPISFYQDMQELMEDPAFAYIEIGRSSCIKQNITLDEAQQKQIVTLLPSSNDHVFTLQTLLTALGDIWTLGGEIKWEQFYAEEKRHKVPLPTYPFERKLYWLEPRRRRFIGLEDDKTELDLLDTLDIANMTPEDLLQYEPDKIEELSNWFFVPTWKQTAVPARITSDLLALKPDKWLVFADNCGVADAITRQLHDAGHSVTLIKQGTQFTQLDTDTYTLSPKARFDYDELFMYLRKQDKLPNIIVHLWLVTPTQDTENLADALVNQTTDHGFYSLLALAQSLADFGPESCRIQIVTSEMQDVIDAHNINPAKATVIGACKVIPQEFTNIQTKSIDIGNPETNQHQIQTLLTELIDTDRTETMVAIRNQTRWVQTYESIVLREGSYIQRLRTGGVYLITGGMGGIGLGIAHYLATTYQAKVALLGRTPLPPREEWDDLLATENPQQGTAYKIAQIHQIEEAGGELLLLTADVTNESDVQQTVATIMHTWGALHGVIHAAAVPASGIIQLKEPEMATAVLAPKVQGTLVLQRALQDIPLDFLVLFSSMSAITGGGPGQIDYCAANAFLDAFARRYHDQHGTTITIGWGEWHWDAWQAGLEGFPPEAQIFFKAKRREFGISMEEGCEALRRLLCWHLPHTIVSTQDFNQMVAGSKDFSIAAILKKIQLYRQYVPKHPRPTLGVPYTPPRTPEEEHIATIWGDLLGIEEVGIYDNFFDLGGNSLLGVDMITRIRQVMEIDNLPVYILYEAPTVYDLVKVILSENGTPKISHDVASDQDETSRDDKRQEALARKREQSV